MGVTSRYAIRSVSRNLRRTSLSILGIGIGCGLALFTESLNRGRDELFARMAAFSGTGHVRVMPAAWRERRDSRLRLADWRADLDAARSLQGVEAVTTRARAQVLLAMGSHVVPLEAVGVDAVNEPRTYRFAQQVQNGRYLQPGERGAAVIGKAVADRLGVEVDDDIMATAVGKGGAIESAMLRVVGIVATGSEEFDAGICQVAMEDVEQLTGLSGAGEVVVMLADWRQSETVRSALAPLVARGDEVLVWGEIAPELKGHIEQDQATSRFVSYVILLIVVLGVASAQLAAVLERRREFAVLSAIGMGTGSMVRLVLQEALALGLAGAVAGLAIGGPMVWWLARVGLDFRKLLGSSYTFEGVVVEPIIYGDLGAWIVTYVIVVAVGATTLASLYPAWFAARTDPAVALRVAQ
jgi:ABC-type lipoprotein release transport system permease subunit